MTIAFELYNTVDEIIGMVDLDYELKAKGR